MFHRPPKKYSEYLVNVEQSIDWILKMLWKLKKGEFTQNLQQVTDEGNTTTNTIDTAGTTSDYFQLDTTATPTLLPGMFGWNDVDGTANLRLKGNNVTLQIGQETLARVVNKTGADLLESQYKVVRVRIASEGGAQGQRLAVVLAQGNNDPDSTTTLGIVTENISNNQEGFITIFGNVNEINTTGSLQGETWVDGDVLYLSPTTPGSLTKVKPIAPDHSVVMGYVIYAHAVHGKIFVKVDNGYELEELHDVLPTPYVNNGVLYRDTTTNLWKSATIATLLGGSPIISMPTLNQVTTAGNTTTNAITIGGATINGNVTNIAPAISNTRELLYKGYTSDVTTDAFFIANGTSADSIFAPLFSGFNSTSQVHWGLGFTGLLTSSNDVSNSSNFGVIRFNVARTDSTSNPLNGNFSAISNRRLFTFENNASALLTMFSTGNIGINTTTDAGHKLDVNGTARIVGDVNMSGQLIVVSAFSTRGLVLNEAGNVHSYTAPNTNRTLSFVTNSQSFRLFPTGNFAINSITDLNAKLLVTGSITASSAIARGVYFNNTLVAAANNDVLVGLDINPTFTNGAFTGITNYLLRAKNNGTLRTQVDQYGRQEWYLNSGTAEIGKIAYSTPGNFPGIIIWTGATYNSNRFNLINNGTYFGLAFDADGAGYGRLNIFNGGVGIGTSTNAGYQLDVNGTVRLKDRLVIDSGSTLDYPITLTTSKTGNNGTVYLANTSSTGQVLMVFHNEVGGNYSYNSYGLLLYGGSGAGDPLFGANRQNRFMIAADGASNLGMYLGTLSAQPLVFGTNNVERIRINSSGSVGIGTTSPSYKLQVVGDIALSGNLVPTAGSQTLGTFTNRFGDVWAGGLIVGTTFYGDNYQTASGTMFFKDGGGVERMRMTSVGNFLIGTTIDPGYKLTVNGDINTSGVFRVGGVAGWTGVITIPTNPPGQQNVDVQGGIIVNVF